MRDLINIFKADPEITEEHIPVEEDVLGAKDTLLLDLENRASARRPNDIAPKDAKKVPDVLPRRKRDVEAELHKFMSEEEALDEAMHPLKQAAMAAAMTGAMAGGAKAVQTHNLDKAEAQAEFTSSYAPQTVGDIKVGPGDWAFNGDVAEPEVYDQNPRRSASLIDRLNPFKKETKKGVQVSDEFRRNLNYMTATIWGEARGEGAEGMEAVGHVIKNRLGTGRWGDSIKDVVLANKQFSCWNPNDENRAKIGEMQEIEKYIRSKPDGFDQWFAKFQESNDYQEYLKWQEARKIAQRILSGKSQDVTNGSIFLPHEGR